VNRLILFALAIFGLLVSSFVPTITTGDVKENNLISQTEVFISLTNQEIIFLKEVVKMR